MGLLFPSLPTVGRPERPVVSVAGVVAAHALLIALVLVIVPAEQLRKLAEPMTVRFIEAMPDLPKPLPVAPPEIPKPKKIVPPQPEQVLAAKTSDAPASFSVPTQPAEPAPPAPPAPAAVTGARFDADYLHNPKPVYPSASRRLSEQGKVLLRVFVSAEGQAEKVEVKTSSGFPRLDASAQEAVARWRFVPARRGDQAVAAWVQVPITFQLES
jgi:periplasmic protein TonB